MSEILVDKPGIIRDSYENDFQSVMRIFNCSALQAKRMLKESDLLDIYSRNTSPEEIKYVKNPND